MWSFALEQAESAELLSIGSFAYNAGKPDTCAGDLEHQFRKSACCT
jgi:hypothetical protein